MPDPLHDGFVRINGERRSLAVGRLSELLAALGCAGETRGLAVAVNGVLVPRSMWGEHALCNGDEIDIVGAVQGG